MYVKFIVYYKCPENNFHIEFHYTSREKLLEDRNNCKLYFNKKLLYRPSNPVFFNFNAINSSPKIK